METFVEIGAVELAVETFGSRQDPAVLLVGSGSMLSWDDELCARLAAGGRFVLRYDLRDHGRSVTYPPGAPRYDLRDLSADVIGVLDAFGLRKAHIAGRIVGGWIAQLTALDHPERVATLTLVSTRPTAHGPNNPDLPEHSAEVMAYVTGTPRPDWSDRAAVVEYLVGAARARSPEGEHFDEAEVRSVAERTYDRAEDMASSFNIAATEPGRRWRERLGELEVPTLVVHGTADRFFPYGNALALAAEIPGARLLPLEGVGQDLPRAAWSALASALLEHTAG
ncbi:alpha/beta fold hydrolase [Allokutzneria albata]|uniref:alpha/beta fold hydrolase n=1 Tax=Allokutzneria albata TaxID=211114 RepID=UPI000B2DEE73|nr:alpha/beta hydrolase [Allokutzneria albata]